ncbi:hypothetical protein FXN63_19760 [Pigmentiphaga aceris]|uniref:Uncharacterized protein n=1 Tax=Pigmentiphaga aceris TaxID=1940612 RepID=A0A5C0AZD5_9BURK|nr:hypothetical protein [Pigmentiphaga aceris]QEI07822.1 hypothetical protein FXN63_19760 [Pigmentiphaga aceris]
MTLKHIIDGVLLDMAPEEDVAHRAAQAAVAPTFDNRVKALTNFVQGHLDAAAQVRRYDDIKTAITYADEPAVPLFQAEGQAFRKWRSLVWAKCYWYLGEVQAGRALEPTEAALIAILPALELPT